MIPCIVRDAVDQDACFGCVAKRMGRMMDEVTPLEVSVRLTFGHHHTKKKTPNMWTNMRDGSPTRACDRCPTDTHKKRKTKSERCHARTRALTSNAHRVVRFCVSPWMMDAPHASYIDATRHATTTMTSKPNDELKRHAAYLIAWCGAIRASTYVLHAIFGEASA